MALFVLLNLTRHLLAFTCVPISTTRVGFGLALAFVAARVFSRSTTCSAHTYWAVLNGTERHWTVLAGALSSSLLRRGSSSVWLRPSRTKRRCTATAPKAAHGLQLVESG